MDDFFNSSFLEIYKSKKNSFQIIDNNDLFSINKFSKSSFKTSSFVLQNKIIGQIVDHNYYSLMYSESHEQPFWVKYMITKNRILNTVCERKDEFRVDPEIKFKSATLKDYYKSGYDRGHLCPAGDMKFSKVAMSESFFMSNMSPQHPSLNRGRWKQLKVK